MKNKRNFAKSSQKDNSVESKNRQKIKKKAQHSVSVVYESLRNSQGGTSPRPSKMIEKYNTYIQFISNNKINTDSFHVSKEELAALKKNVLPTAIPRKNSPVPYAKGRKSAFSKFSQPPSPINRQSSQRNSFPRSLPHESKNQNSYFIIRGNYCNSKQKIMAKRNNSQMQNKNNKQNKKISKNYKENSNNMQREVKEKYQQKASKYEHKKGIENKTKQNRKPQNKSINREQMQSQNVQKLDRDQSKLCQKLFKGIQFYRDLGKGAHALVRSAVDWNNKRKIAVKIYDKSELTQEQIKSIQREIQILMTLKHPNIIKLYQIIQTYKTINLMMEYGGGNSLDQYIKSKAEGFLNDKEAKLIFRQVLDAVQHLHDMNITHRDIKPENILLNKHLNLKIIDFGFSLVVSQVNKFINSYCGTPTYMPPEVVSKRPHNPQLADRWSLGVLLFTMLNGCCPFRATTQKELFAKINKTEFEYMRANVNLLAKDLIGKFMRYDPEERLSAKDALEHPWMQTN